MRTLRKLLASAILGSVLLIAPAALADGIGIGSSALPNDARAKLENDIAAAKASQPKAFLAVKNVKGHRPEHYSKNRNPFGCEGLNALDQKANPGAQPDCCYTFGGVVDRSEHCNIFAYYYPKADDVNCF